MADNELTVRRATGEVKTLRSRDVAGGGTHAQLIDVGPWLPTPVSSTWNQTVQAAIYTLTTPATATHVLLSIDAGAVRYTEDGSNPTVTNGIYLAAGFIGELAIPAGQNLLFYRAEAANGRLNASFRKYV